ncbi:hypothetical protein EBA04_08790 [Xanthomonas oryzae pv. oryzae]|nr:hypothetical protein EBA04_08790 [Xanthomonas oryzae pv. oryzae]
MVLERRSDQALALFLAMTTFFGGVTVGSVVQDYLASRAAPRKRRNATFRAAIPSQLAAAVSMDCLKEFTGGDPASGQSLVVGLNVGDDQGSSGDHPEKSEHLQAAAPAKLIVVKYSATRRQTFGFWMASVAMSVARPLQTPPMIVIHCICPSPVVGLGRSSQLPAGGHLQAPRRKHRMS